MILDDAIFRLMVENAFDIATILAADGTIRYESPAVQRVLGFTPEELEGQNAFAFVHADDQERVQLYFRQVVLGISDGSGVTFRFRHKEGRWIYLEVTGTSMLHDPRVRGVIVNSRDVTERMLASRPAAPQSTALSTVSTSKIDDVG